MAQHHTLEEFSVPVAGTHVFDERVRITGRRADRGVDEDVWISSFGQEEALNELAHQHWNANANAV